MIADAPRLPEDRAFMPFAVRTSDGREYPVPNVGHAKLNPRGTHLIIFFGDDRHVPISGLHLVTVIEKVAA